MDNFKDWKMIDGRTIRFLVDDQYIWSICGPFRAKYPHADLNKMIDLHSKILTPKQLKDVKAFVTELREPPQLSLF